MWAEYGLSFRLSDILEPGYGTHPRAYLLFLRDQIHMLTPSPQSWSTSQSSQLIETKALLPSTIRPTSLG